MSASEQLTERLHELCPGAVREVREHRGETTLVVDPGSILTLCGHLRDHPDLAFEQLIDVCGVDYLRYGYAEGGPSIRTWSGQQRPGEFVERSESARAGTWDGPRFAVVYHLLSVRHNRRVRLRALLADNENPVIESVVGLWPAADWFEREAFDLYGILFEGHPDLRRILTDYGFIGHPFRKDFPLIGHVEMRYDADRGRVVYQPVSIEPRVTVPRVIREEGFGGRNP